MRLRTDRPLGLMRMDNGGLTTAFYPQLNWRGLYETATTDTGTEFHSRDYIKWPGAVASAYLGANTKPDSAFWWYGSQITDQADASGLMYRRNRYYDPASGRFTQPDPAGIGGGLNGYGFAGGDPVNYTDPFGLKQCPPDCDGASAATVAIPVSAPVAVPSASELAPVAPLAVLGSIGYMVARPAFPGAGKVSLGRGQGTWASEATETSGVPELPEGLTGENPREGSGNRINTDSKKDPQQVFEDLTGGHSTTEPNGHHVAPNGVRLRPGTEKQGPRIDIPARPPRPHETIHFPSGSE